MLAFQDKDRWELVGRLELNLRHLVSDVLIEAFGDTAWEDGIPKGTRDRIIENISKLQQRAVEQVPELEERLHYCDLGGLFEIVRVHWNAMFSGQLGPDKALWDMQTDVISRMRNALDHYRKEMLPTGNEDLSLRPLFDLVAPLQLRTAYKALARRGLSCLEPIVDVGESLEREDSPALQSRDYVHFVGRALEVNQVLGFLTEEVPVVVIHGIGGVGKTATCIEAARRAFRAGVYDEIVYAPVRRGFLMREQAATAPSPFENYEEFLRLTTMTLGGNPDPGIELIELERQAIEMLARQRTLLIVDNFETLRDQAQLSEFLWKLPKETRALVTTRLPPSTGGRYFPLDELSKDDLKEIIRNECALKGKPKLVNVDAPGVMDRIYSTIGGIPLAAKLLVGMMTSELKSLDTVLGSIAAGEKTKLVDFCFARIYNEGLTEDARQTMKAFGFLGTEASRPELEATTALPSNRLGDALVVLEMSSLISRIAVPAGDDSYRMLPLTRVYARQRLLDSPGLETAMRKRIQTFKEAKGGKQPAGTPAGQEALRLANAARIRLRQGNLAESLELAQKAMSVDDSISMVYLVYGMVEDERGNLGEAETILQAGYRMFPADSKLAHKLAMVTNRLGRFPEANDLYRSILVLAPTTSLEIIQAEYTLKGLAANYIRWIRFLRESRRYPEVRARAEEFLHLVDSEMKYPGPLPRDTDFLVRQVRQTLGIQLTISKAYPAAEEALLKALIENPASPSESRHNESVLKSLRYNVEKWNPPDVSDRIARYERRVDIRRPHAAKPYQTESSSGPAPA